MASIDAAADRDAGDGLTGVGYNLGTFVIDTFRPTPGGTTTVLQAWDAYKVWCGKQSLAPLSYPLFVVHMMDVVKIGRIPIVTEGSHIVLHGVIIEARG